MPQIDDLLITDKRWAELARRLRPLCDMGEVLAVAEIMAALSNAERLEFYESIRSDSWLRNSIKACQQEARYGTVGETGLTYAEYDELMRRLYG